MPAVDVVIATEVGAELKMVALHPVVVLQLLRQPSSRGDAIETESVRVLGQHAFGADRIERRLEVLDEVELATLDLGVAHGVGGGPGGGEERVTFAHRGEVVQHRGAHRRVVVMQYLRRLRRQLRLVRVVDVDAARVAVLLEGADEAKYVQMAARARADGRRNPSDRFRGGSPFHRGWNAPALRP